MPRSASDIVFCTSLASTPPSISWAAAKSTLTEAPETTTAFRHDLNKQKYEICVLLCLNNVDQHKWQDRSTIENTCINLIKYISNNGPWRLTSVHSSPHRFINRSRTTRRHCTLVNSTTYLKLPKVFTYSKQDIIDCAH